STETQVQNRHAVKQVAISFLIASIGMAHAAEPLPEYAFIESVKAGASMTSFRLRYEHVDQDTLPENAEALTLRSLIGWQSAPYKNFSFGVQLIDVAKLVDDYNDRALNRSQPGMASYPNVVDPDDTGINQLFVEWSGISKT